MINFLIQKTIHHKKWCNNKNMEKLKFKNNNK